jgi:hypothetical protein
MVSVQAQDGQRILELMGDLRGHATERGQRSAAQALELVRVADGHGRLGREERQQLQVVLVRLDAIVGP